MAEQSNRHATSLAKLAEIFQEKLAQIETVNSPTTQTSATLTASEAIHLSLRLKQQRTCANTPDMLPPSSRVIAAVIATTSTPLVEIQMAKKTVTAPRRYKTPREKRARTRVITEVSPKQRFNMTKKTIHVPM